MNEKVICNTFFSWVLNGRGMTGKIHYMHSDSYAWVTLTTMALLTEVQDSEENRFFFFKFMFISSRLPILEVFS